MPEMYAVKGNTLTDIANAIRGKSGKTEKLTVNQMAEEIKNLNVTEELKPFKPLSVNYNGVYEEYSYAYSPVIVDFPEQSTNGDISNNTNPDGSWKKPEEYPDIGQIQLEENEAYFLCKNHLGARFWCVKVSFTGSLLFERGHMEGEQFVSDKVYDGTIVNNNFLGCMFDDDMPEYIVFHIKASSQLRELPLQGFNTSGNISNAKFLDGSLVPAGYSRWNQAYVPVLWRRARLPYATNATIGCYFLEKDEVVDLHTKATGNITFASMYTTCYNLVEIHIDGNIGNFSTNCSNMFSHCYSLTKIDLNIKNIVGSKCTSIERMFQNCYSLKELDISNWNTSNITNANYVFAGMHRIIKIIGIEKLNFPKATTFSNILENTWNLRQEDGTLDLSNWFVGTINLPTNTSAMFSNLRSIKKLNVDGLNLSNCTNISSMFGNMWRVDEIVGNITPSTSKLTNCSSLFNACYSLKRLPNLTGWDLSKATDVNSMFSGLYGIRELNTDGIIFPTVNTKHDNFFRYCYQLINLNASNIDLKYASASYSNFISDCRELIEFYPPQNIGYGNRACNFSFANMLSHDSLLRILNNLATVTTATTLTLGKANLDVLTDEEKAIATSKGWTLA